MTKFLSLCLILLALAGPGVRAQTVSDSDLFHSGGSGLSDASPAPAAEPKKTGTAQAPQGPTTIDSDNMDYDEKTRIAIFTGDNYGVYVKDPSFTIYCDKLTAHMRKASGPAPPIPGVKGKKVTPKPTPTPTPAPTGKSGAADASSSRSNGLQSALAEGITDQPVVVVQDKPGANGGPPEHDVGIAQKADYNADSGDVKLIGWPRVSQGINTQIATASYTIMIMNKAGHTMKTIGPSRTVIQEQEEPKKTGTDSDSSPSPTPQ
jgi:lipopolysaccharide export system protein LptA